MLPEVFGHEGQAPLRADQGFESGPFALQLHRQTLPHTPHHPGPSGIPVTGSTLISKGTVTR